MLRRLLGISKPYSVSKMFVSRGIPTFAELLRTSIYRFAQRIEHSSNHIISATLAYFDAYFLTDPKMVELHSLCQIAQCNACVIVCTYY